MEAVHGAKGLVEAGELRRWHLSELAVSPLGKTRQTFPGVPSACLTKSKATPAHLLFSGL